MLDVLGRTRFHGWLAASRVWTLALTVCSMGISDASGQSVVTAQGPYRAAIDGLDRWIEAERIAKSLPALSIALVDENGLIWSRGFGFADKPTGIDATAETIYRVGPFSAAFTYLAVMRLSEQGRLDLDAPAVKYLPEFAPRNHYSTAVTVRHLLTQQSGLPREAPLGHWFDPEPRSLIDVVRGLSTSTITARPGAETRYSNAGVAALGAIVERVSGEPFARTIKRTLLDPIGMSRSGFEPDQALAHHVAKGTMWTYDGQQLATPTFLVGEAPAASLSSTAIDLARFVRFVLAGGGGPGGEIASEQSLRTLVGKGHLFASEMLGGRSVFRHGGGIYGFSTEIDFLPNERLGVVVMASADSAQGILRRIGDTTLECALAARSGKPQAQLESTSPIPRERAIALAGEYSNGDQTIDLASRADKLFLSPYRNLTVELRSSGESLIVDDRLAFGAVVEVDGDQIKVDGVRYRKQPGAKPPPCPAKSAGLIGEYGWDHQVVYLLEKRGRLHALLGWFAEYPLVEDKPDVFRFSDSNHRSVERLVVSRDGDGSGAAVTVHGVTFPRRHLDGEGGKTYRIKPRRSVEEIRREIATAKPPAEPKPRRNPELVDLTSLDLTIRLDIRYATTNNFLGVPLYTSARAFLERPAADALLSVHQALERDGYGLLIHDAYRPWNVTKLFWEATPDSGRGFVADPAKGSRHNRGAAVDLTMYDRATGRPVVMVGGYDEFSPRSNPDYPGGTSLERWQRDLLRKAMESRGFTVNEVEWWHFDHDTWRDYPIINRRFEDLASDGQAR